MAIAGDWQVARRLSRVPHPYTAEDARFFLDHVVTTEATWAMILKATQAMVGAVGLTRRTEGTAELGYYVGQPHWGRGYASEAAAAVVNHGFTKLGLSLIVGGFLADNPASGQVLLKLGFEVTGAGERFSMATGTAMPSVEVELTRERWERFRTGLK